MQKGYRGRLFDFKTSAEIHDLEKGFKYFEDGLLIVKDGFVENAGDFQTIFNKTAQSFEIENLGKSIIMPGFIDTHVHSVQTKAIASFGKELLDWLDNYIFPAERKYEDPEYATFHTKFFLKNLLKNGTTTALVYPSVHETSTSALFDTAMDLNMRLIAGNTWMDRNAPGYLLENCEASYKLSSQLIKKYHNRSRLKFAVTPRYAITSSPEALKLAASLFHEYDDLYLQTHISENRKEIEMVNHSYPNHRNYLDVYDDFGMLTERTFLGHGIYLEDDELKRISKTGTKIVHCPTSNLFLGSGLFDYQKPLHNNIQVTLGSDVGGGTSFSMLQTLQDAYKISAIKGSPMSPLLMFYLITLGAAKALGLENRIGNFDKGKEADFVVLDPDMNPLLKYRIEESVSPEDLLFAMMILGDDRIVKETYLMGKAVGSNQSTAGRNQI
ncbi:MAG: guanine deaminase [Bacteroidales bacterium]|nr:guanine deaminase [Bacteroidales bacterium]